MIIKNLTYSTFQRYTECYTQFAYFNFCLSKMHFKFSYLTSNVSHDSLHKLNICFCDENNDKAIFSFFGTQSVQDGFECHTQIALMFSFDCWDSHNQRHFASRSTQRNKSNIRNMYNIRNVK